MKNKKLKYFIAFLMSFSIPMGIFTLILRLPDLLYKYPENFMYAPLFVFAGFILCGIAAIIICNFFLNIFKL